MNRARLLLPLLLSSSPLLAQDAATVGYWDMDTLDADTSTTPLDIVGHAETIAGPNLLLETDPYGSSPAGGNYLRTTRDDFGKPLEADVITAGTMDFGSDSLSFSYWTYNDTTDNESDVRGPRVFDCLADTSTGLQVGTNLTGIFNFRIDDDADTAIISNQQEAPFDTLMPPADEWVHVAITINRDAAVNLAEIFFDAVSIGTYDLSTLTGNVFATQALQIGCINGGSNASGLQTAGLDDLAFYTGVLTQEQITALHGGAKADVVAPPAPPKPPEPPTPIGYYWDFTFDGVNTPQDLYGGLVTSEPAQFVDLSIDSFYGEAFSGSGVSFNQTIPLDPADNAYLKAESHNGANATALDFGSKDFSFSYWAFDHSDDTTNPAGDGDPRGVRVFDCLAGDTTGLTVNSDAEGHLVVRIDDDEDNAFISNTIPGFETLAMPANRWVHVAMNIDRTAQLLTIYFDGTQAASIDLSILTGKVFCSTDLQIGVINGGGSATTTQKGGLDELAFYGGLLSQDQITALANATTTPLDLLPTFEPIGELEITDVRYSAGEVSIDFNTVSGSIYSVFGGPALADSATWPELSTSDLDGTGESISFSYTPPGDSPVFFLQVRED